jgi:hypothetical protein
MQFNLLPFLTRYTNHAGFSNDTPREYLCNLGPDGRRRDADDRPELCRGAVEFIASKEFLVCPCLTECSCHFLLARLVNHSVVLVVISCAYIFYIDDLVCMIDQHVSRLVHTLLHICRIFIL